MTGSLEVDDQYALCTIRVENLRTGASRARGGRIEGPITAV